MTSPDAPVHQTLPTEPVQFEDLLPPARVEAVLAYMSNSSGQTTPRLWWDMLHYAGYDRPIPGELQRHIGSVLDNPNVQRENGGYFIPPELTDETYQRLGISKQMVAEHIGRVISADFDKAINDPR